MVAKFLPYPLQAITEFRKTTANILQVDAVGLGRLHELVQEGLHVGEVLVDRALQEVKESGVVDGLGVNELNSWSGYIHGCEGRAYLVDTADPEAEGTALVACPIHVITDEQDKLMNC